MFVMRPSATWPLSKRWRVVSSTAATSPSLSALFATAGGPRPAVPKINWIGEPALRPEMGTA